MLVSLYAVRFHWNNKKLPPAKDEMIKRMSCIIDKELGARMYGE